MDRLRFVIPLLAFLFLANPAQGGDPAAEIRTLGDELVELTLRRQPLAATYRGNYEYNDLVQSFSLNQFDEDQEEVQGFMTRLKAINKTDLSDADQLNFDLLEAKFRYFLDGYMWAMYTLTPLTRFEGIHNNAARIASSSTLGDFENYIARLSAVPEQVDDIIERCRLAIELNRTLHNVSVTPVVDKLNNSIFGTPEESPYYTPFGDKLNNSNVQDTKLMCKLRKRGKTAVTLLMDAMQKLQDFLVDEYLPNTRIKHGVYAWDPDFYAAALKWHLTEDITPEEVHSIGLSEVERINTLMQQTMERLGFNGTIRQFYDSLKGDSRFFANDSAGVLQHYEDVIEEIKPKMSQYFKNYPDYRIEVRSKPGSYASYNPVTQTNPGYFNANAKDPANHPSYTAMTLAVHEAIPGHHLQSSYMLRSPLPEFRTLPIIYFYNVPYEFVFYTSHIEGWGLYAEYLAEEMGLYKDDYDMMGRYLFEMLRAVRLVVDTGLHYKGWSRDKALEYLMKYVAQAESVNTAEIDRYITLPGQACAYKIGEIFIKQLRQTAETELGGDFDIAGFHEIFLENGYLPLYLLKEMTNDWIAETKAKVAEAA